MSDILVAETPSPESGLEPDKAPAGASLANTLKTLSGGNLLNVLKHMSAKKTKLFFTPSPDDLNTVSNEALDILGIPHEVTSFFPYSFQAFGSKEAWIERKKGGHSKSLPFYSESVAPYTMTGSCPLGEFMNRFKPIATLGSGPTTMSRTLWSSIYSKSPDIGEVSVQYTAYPPGLWNSAKDPDGSKGEMVSCESASRVVRCSFIKATKGLIEPLDRFFNAMALGYRISEPAPSHFNLRHCRLINKYTGVPGMTCYTLLVSAIDRSAPVLPGTDDSETLKSIKKKDLIQGTFFYLIWVTSEKHANPLYSIASTGGITWIENCVGYLPQGVVNTPWGERFIEGRLPLGSKESPVYLPAEIPVSVYSRVNWNPLMTGTDPMSSKFVGFFKEVGVRALPVIEDCVRLCAADTDSDLAKYVRCVISGLSMSVGEMSSPFTLSAKEWSEKTANESTHMFWTIGTYTSTGRLDTTPVDHHVIGTLTSEYKRDVEDRLRTILKDSQLAIDLGEKTAIGEAFKKLFS